MNEPAVRVFTCAGGARWEPDFLRAVQAAASGIVVERRCVDHGELLGLAGRDRPAAVVVTGALPWVDRELVAALHREGVAVVAVAGASEGDRAVLERCGADAVVAADAGGREIGAAVLDSTSRAARGRERNLGDPPGDAGRGALVVVWGPGGAPGRTTLAVHLASREARRGRSVLLVDADVWAASIAQLLALDEGPGLARAARLAIDGWPEPLDVCVKWNEGMHVITGLPRAELWPEVGEQAATAVLAQARALADLVVVDVAAPIEEDEELAFDRVPYRRNRVTRVALGAADAVLLTANTDPIGLRRAVVAHHELATALPTASAVTSVVLNRAGGGARRIDDCIAAVEEWTGHTPEVVLPHEPALARVAWEGRPLPFLVRRSPWLDALDAVELPSRLPAVAS